MTLPGLVSVTFNSRMNTGKRLDLKPVTKQRCCCLLHQAGLTL